MEGFGSTINTPSRYYEMDFGPIKKLIVLQQKIKQICNKDTAAATIKFHNGSLGIVEATTAARPVDLHASLSIVGEKGTAVIGGLAMNEIKSLEIYKTIKKKRNRS